MVVDIMLVGALDPPMVLLLLLVGVVPDPPMLPLLKYEATKM